MTWNNTSPAVGSSIAADVADILENFQHAHDTSGNVDKVLGILTNASHPAFSVRPAGDQENITANGSDVTVVFDEEVFDRGTNFAANAFTAPATGLYQLNVFLQLADLDSAASTIIVKLVTTARTYTATLDPQGFSGDLGAWNVNISVLADMAATNTATVKVNQPDGAGQLDVKTASCFSGFFVA